MQEILLNVESKEIRYANLQYGKLQHFLIERKRSRQITGNIYRGNVTNILHNIQSAFININEAENGFIHISDILENTKKFEELFDMDFDLDYDISSMKEPHQTSKDISQYLKIDQPVLVQVVKEPIGTKGARLTSNLSIAGRYLVLLPNNPHKGVSRKIENRSLRESLKNFLRSLEIPEGIGLICRTASAHATEDMLVEEAKELLQFWDNIIEKFHKANKPACLYEESDIIKKALIIAVDQKVDRVLIDDYATYQTCRRIYQRYENEHPLKIEFYRDSIPMFERFNVEKEIDRALKRKVWLSSGGYLFFDRTEAMHTIDVNSGRSQTPSNNDVEETLVRINLEAAEEIARQLRLRNVGGLIVCDFIDMRFRKNQRRVLDRLKEAMKADSAKCTILGMSEFGLIEMTRQRARESLSQTIFTQCPYCEGQGTIKNYESVSIEIERYIKKLICHEKYYALKLVTHPHLLKFIEEHDQEFLCKLSHKHNARLEFAQDEDLHLNDFVFYSTLNNEKIEL